MNQPWPREGPGRVKNFVVLCTVFSQKGKTYPVGLLFFNLTKKNIQQKKEEKTFGHQQHTLLIRGDINLQDSNILFTEHSTHHSKSWLRSQCVQATGRLSWKGSLHEKTH